MYLIGLFVVLPYIRAIENNTTLSNGYQLWQVHFENGSLSEEVSRKLHQQDIWGQDNDTIDFLVSENDTLYWRVLLKAHNLTHKVLSNEVKEKINPDILMKNYDARRGMSWTSYPKLNDIYDYLKEVAAANPTVCTLSVIGKTVHKKDIKLLKIRNSNSKKQHPVLVEGGIHGREWTSVLSVLYIIESIAWNFTKQPQHIQSKEWNFIPVLNPEGYEYSMTTDRTWRKNRRRLSGGCYGVDINRNFDYRWGESDSTIDLCGIHYCGPAPFSEPESMAVKDLIQSHRFRAYVSIHSFGSRVLYPWSPRGPTHDTPTHKLVSREMVGAMRAVKGEHYLTGHVVDFGIKSGTGTSTNWLYFVHNIEDAYIIETRGRGTGDYILDPNELIPAVKEVRAGVMRLSEILA